MRHPLIARWAGLLSLLGCLIPFAGHAVDARKELAFEVVERNAEQAALLSDSIFYFGELGMQEFESAGEGNHAFGVFDFAAFDFAIFGDVVGVREKFADGGDAGAAVSPADDFVGDEAVLHSPFGPHAGDCRSRIHEHAVEVKEHTAALNVHVSMI